MIAADKLLAALPPGLREPLIAEFKGISTAFLEGRWKLSSLDAGRFCEVVYTILDGAAHSPENSLISLPSPRAFRKRAARWRRGQTLL
jgi:hypothetical protein